MNKLTLSEIKKYFKVSEDTVSCILDITPEDAKLLLSYNNDNNRTLSRRTVLRLTDQMNRGEFRLSPDNISFDDKGTLTNGQHRLKALSESEVESIKLGVSFGIEAFPDMDTGKRRTVTDAVLILKDDFNINLTDECVVISSKIVESYVNFATGKYTNLAKSLSKQQVMEIVKFFEDDLRVCYESGLFDKHKGVSQIPVLTAFFGAYLNGVSIDTLKHIKKVLSTGYTEEGIGDVPIIKLRDNIIRNIYRGSGSDRSKIAERYCLTCSCISKVVGGNTSDKPRLRSDVVMYGYEGIPHVV